MQEHYSYRMGLLGNMQVSVKSDAAADKLTTDFRKHGIAIVEHTQGKFKEKKSNTNIVVRFNTLDYAKYQTLFNLKKPGLRDGQSSNPTKQFVCDSEEEANVYLQALKDAGIQPLTGHGYTSGIERKHSQYIIRITQDDFKKYSELEPYFKSQASEKTLQERRDAYLVLLENFTNDPWNNDFLYNSKTNSQARDIILPILSKKISAEDILKEMIAAIEQHLKSTAWRSKFRNEPSEKLITNIQALQKEMDNIYNGVYPTALYTKKSAASTEIVHETVTVIGTLQNLQLGDNSIVNTNSSVNSGSASYPPFQPPFVTNIPQQFQPAGIGIPFNQPQPGGIIPNFNPGANQFNNPYTNPTPGYQMHGFMGMGQPTTPTPFMTPTGQVQSQPQPPQQHNQQTNPQHWNPAPSYY